MFALTKEKMFFSEHLSLMIKGGASISEAIETLKKGTKLRSFKKALDDVLKRILQGEALNKSLARHPKVFDKFFCDIVRVGEESGTLEENLKYLSVQLREEFEMKKKIRGALIYPSLVIILALIIIFVVSFFVLPRFLNLFSALKISLPLATKILIAFSSFLTNYWIGLLIGLFLGILIFRIVIKLKFVKLFFDRIFLSFPVFSKIIKNINLARFSRTFYTLLKSGVPVLGSLDICGNIIPNEVYKKSLSSVTFRVAEGRKISGELKKNPNLFPAVFSQMVVVGERSGSLEDSFLYLAEFHEREVDSTLKNLSNILEPFLLILVGIFVCFIGLAIITPIYKFTGGLRIR